MWTIAGGILIAVAVLALVPVVVVGLARLLEWFVDDCLGSLFTPRRDPLSPATYMSLAGKEHPFAVQMRKKAAKKRLLIAVIAWVLILIAASFIPH